MKNGSQEIWIEMGYAIFAQEGLRGLKIEVLAKRVNKNKSSFYHHFADLDCFVERLLEMHLERAKDIAVRENACTSIDPELIAVLVEAKEDLRFNRQLRVARTNVAFRDCFEQTNRLVGEAFFQLWAREFSIVGNPKLVETLFGLVLENFYLQLTDETLTVDWLSAYFQKIKGMVAQLSQA